MINKKLIDRAVKEIAKAYAAGLDVTSANISKDYIQLQIGASDVEIFCVMFLNTQNQLIEFRKMFNGTIDAASVYPREVVREALLLNAKSVILAHNHPSGRLEPSSSDLNMTERIKKACNLLDINLLDHIIASKLGAMSFSERGLL
jgi:DNA repair protein RadC